MHKFSVKSKISIAVIGIGYVGLPLSIEFGKKYQTVGFDTNKERINDLIRFRDRTNEISKAEIKKSKHIHFTSRPTDLKDSNVYIVTVPTPILKNRTPDLRPIKNATSLISKYITKNDVIIY